MHPLLRKTASITLSLALLSGAGFIVYENRVTVEQNLIRIKEFFLPTPPCTEPLLYTIGTVDSRFGLPTSDFANIITKAADSWSAARGTKLFVQTSDVRKADFTVNLIYDLRQETTNKLSDISVVLEDGKASYNDIQQDYATLLAEYKRQKAAYDERVKIFEAQRNVYEAQVARWNQQGGAPKQEYTRLEQARKALNTEADAINKESIRLNTTITNLNALGNEQNQLARELNQTVHTYNTIGATVGEEFSEGEYIVDREGTRINIYQYSNLAELSRVLKHEFGHALGMDHASDPDAIMYHLNESTNPDLTLEDKELLAAVCTE